MSCEEEPTLADTQMTRTEQKRRPENKTFFTTDISTVDILPRIYHFNPFFVDIFLGLSKK